MATRLLSQCSPTTEAPPFRYPRASTVEATGIPGVVLQATLKPSNAAATASPKKMVSMKRSRRGVDWSRLFSELRSLQALQRGWDGYNAPPPAYYAIELARLVLEKLLRHNIPPLQSSHRVMEEWPSRFERETATPRLSFAMMARLLQ